MLTPSPLLSIAVAVKQAASSSLLWLQTVEHPHHLSLNKKKKKKVGKVLSALPRALEEWVSKEGRIERKFRIIDPLQIQHTHPVAFLKLPRKGEKRKKRKEKRSGEDPHSYVETG